MTTEHPNIPRFTQKSNNINNNNNNDNYNNSNNNNIPRFMNQRQTIWNPVSTLTLIVYLVLLLPITTPFIKVRGMLNYT